MGKNFINRGMMLLASALAIASCSNEAEEMRPQGTRALDVQVAVNPTSRAQVIGTSLPEGAQICVNVTATDGSEYDGQNAGYLNVAYTATGTGGTQTWGSTAPVMLSGTEGKLYAYYPHTADVDYKAIEVNIADQHDWMVGAEAYTVSDKAPSVDITMNHVQTALNINVVRDNAYTGAGLVETLAITSEGLASEGTLDTRDGSWSAVNGANTAISIISAPFTLDGTTLTNQENPYMFVPASAETKDFTVSATVDGKAYNVGVAMNEAFASGKMYQLNVKLTNTGLVVSKVTLTDWVIDTTLGDVTFAPDKYIDWVKLTYKVEDNSTATQIFSSSSSFDIGSVAEMAVLENESSRAVAEPISVTPTKAYQFSKTGTHTVYVKFADMTKIPNSAFTECTGLTEVTIGARVMKLANYTFDNCTGLEKITSLSTLAPIIETYTFSNVKSGGVLYVPAGSDYSTWKRQLSGWTLQEIIGKPTIKVYAMSANNEIIDYSTADATAKGVVLHAIGKNFNKKFMIAKADASYNDCNTFYYKTDAGDCGLMKYKTLDGVNYFGSLGNLETPQLSKDFTNWKEGALSDFSGKTNSSNIATLSTQAFDMGYVLKNYNSSEKTAGRENDWYIPAFGQLALMYLAKAEINTVLEKIGGTTLEPDYYWSSTEADAHVSVNYACSINFTTGWSGIQRKNEYSLFRVRFIRNIE